MLQKYTKNNPTWLKLHFKSFQKSTKQMRKKIQKISFFWHDPFSGYTDKPKKFKSLTAMLKSLLKCSLNIISYGITHSVCGILLPK